MKNDRTAGHTLLEVVVTLVVLGIMAGIAIVSISGRTPRETHSLQARAAEARREAIRLGHPVSVRDSLSGYEITAFADGSVVSDANTVDRLTGAPRAR